MGCVSSRDSGDGGGKGSQASNKGKATASRNAKSKSKSGTTGKKERTEYIKVNKIGCGASCEVWSCNAADEDAQASSNSPDSHKRNKSQQAQFAQKVITNPDENLLTMYKAEVNLLEKLVHPNIIEFVESWTSVDNDVKTLNIVTRMCHGGELFDRVSSTGVFTEKDAAGLTKQMLLALEHCHRKNIVHRDLKPENFVFESTAPDSNMKLIDFGSSLEVTDDMIVEDTAGSPYYVAPEVLDPDYDRTGGVWKGSDMWSIGVIVFIFLCGYPPFNGSTQEKILNRIRLGRYSFPATDSLSDEGKDFIKRLLRRKPLDRISATQALQHAWLSSAPDTPIDSAVVKSLAKFHTDCQLRRAVGKVLANTLPRSMREEITSIFQRFDTNKDGNIDIGELKLMMQHLKLTKAESKHMMAEMDEDGDGTISEKEFTTFMSIQYNGSQPSQIKKSFDLFDEDGNGYVTPDEIKNICNFLNAKEVANLIAQVDENGDGKIDYDEWMAGMASADMEEICGSKSQQLSKGISASDVRLLHRNHPSPIEDGVH